MKSSLCQTQWDVTDEERLAPVQRNLSLVSFGQHTWSAAAGAAHLTHTPYGTSIPYSPLTFLDPDILKL